MDYFIYTYAYQSWLYIFNGPVRHGIHVIFFSEEVKRNTMLQLQIIILFYFWYCIKNIQKCKTRFIILIAFHYLIVLWLMRNPDSSLKENINF